MAKNKTSKKPSATTVATTAQTPAPSENPVFSQTPAPSENPISAQVATTAAPAARREVKITHHSARRLRIRIKQSLAKVDANALASAFSARFAGRFAEIRAAARCAIITSDARIDAAEAAQIEEFFATCELPQRIERAQGPSMAPIYASFAALAHSYIAPAVPGAPLASPQAPATGLRSPAAAAMSSTAAALPLLKDGALDLLENGITSHALEAAAVAISLLRKDYRAANSTNFMLALGEYIEEATSQKSDELIKQLARPSITEAWVERAGQLHKVAIAEVAVGDVVVASAGESIAVDGYVLEGDALVNQVSMTGEAEPVAKARGAKVLSGTVVTEGRIKIWAEGVGENSSTAKITRYIEESLREKSAIGAKAVALADKLVPVTLALAGLGWALKGPDALASVLQADYSCALKLATPVAFKSAISYAGKRAVLLKGSDVLERLAAVDTVVFDKTGTLTHGNLTVASVHCFAPDYDEARLLNLSASAEEHYFHPVAEAIVRAAHERGFSHIDHGEVDFIVAHGVRTSIDGAEVLIGSRHFLEDDSGVNFSAAAAEVIDGLLARGLTLLYVARGTELLGVIAMQDDVRQNAAEVIAGLKQNGVREVIMLSGDVRERAEEVGAALGIDVVHAQLLPQDKAAILEQLKAAGRTVAFVGDGINDAPSLVQAQVGISMAKGADLAKASADISLLRDDIACVLEAKVLANETMRKINAAFKTTVWANSAILGAATLGWLSPAATAFAHNGTTIALLANAIRQKKLF